MWLLTEEGEETVNENRWERYGAAAGVAFAVLAVVSFLMVPSPPHIDAGVRKIADYYANHRRALLTSNVIFTIGALAFIWFLGHLRHVLNRAEGGVEALSPIVYGAGLVGAVMAMMSALPGLVLAFSAHQPVVFNDNGIVRLMYDLNSLMGAMAAMAAGLFAAAAGWAMVRKELVGPWMGWIGLASAGLLWASGIAGFYLSTYSGFWAGMMLISGLGFVAWVLAASAVMFRVPEVERTTAWEPVFAH